MEFLVGLILGFVISLICYITYLAFMNPYKCDGEIVMHGDEMYLAISDEDKEAFQKNRYATLKLVRKDFKGFNGN